MTGNILVTKVLNTSSEIVASPSPFPSFSFSSSSPPSLRCSRHVLDNLIDSIITCLEDNDVDSLKQKLDPKIQYKTEGHTIDDIEEVIAFLSSFLSSFSSLKFYVKRKIIDEEQGIIALEAVTRTVPSSSSSSRPSSPSSSVLSSSPPFTSLANEPISSSPPSSAPSSRSTSPSSRSSSRPTSPSSIIAERQIAWMLQCNADGKVKQWTAWKDPVWQVAIADMHTPLPKEVWHPSSSSSSSPSLSSRSYIEDLMIKNSKLYANNEMKKWAEECAHNEVIMHPPWDTLIGRDCCLKAAHIFHSEYRDTVITPVRLVYDEQQPGIVAYHQIFQTTNRESGKIGKDEDYVFVEVVEGKIRYWRTYFDTGNSTQTTNQTFKSKVISASLGKEAR